MKKNYRITLRTVYGSLDVDNIVAETEEEAIKIAIKMASEEVENSAKVDEVYCYG